LINYPEVDAIDFSSFVVHVVLLAVESKEGISLVENLTRLATVPGLESDGKP
jgi:hypothetical protein